MADSKTEFGFYGMGEIGWIIGGTKAYCEHTPLRCGERRKKDMEVSTGILIGTAVELVRQRAPEFQAHRESAKVEAGLDDAVRVYLLGYVDGAATEYRAYAVAFRASGTSVDRVDWDGYYESRRNGQLAQFSIREVREQGLAW
jgi:hypothetical protein